MVYTGETQRRLLDHFQLYEREETILFSALKVKEKFTFSEKKHLFKLECPVMQLDNSVFVVGSKQRAECDVFIGDLEIIVDI